MRRAFLLFVVLAACEKDKPPVPAASATASAASAAPSVVESIEPPPAPTPVTREEKTVTIDGVVETWRLEWVRPAAPTCMGDESIASCPCAPFTFGEVGELDLVRVRPGTPDDRLHLSPLFEGHDAKLRRWAPTAAEEKAIKAPPLAELQARALAPLITFGDYDHDGRATEFVLAVGAEPCGHVQTVVIGIDKRNPKLHAFGSGDKPTEPIVLDRPGDWDKVMRKVPVDLLETGCGDHGAEVEAHVTVSVDVSGLRVAPSTKPCK